VCQMSPGDSHPGGDKKYELAPDRQIVVAGATLCRVRARMDFGNVKAGDLGGFVGSERNLSQLGECWVSDDAQVYDEAVVADDAQVRGCARVYGHARISDKGQVLGNAQVFEHGWVFKNGIVFDNAKVFGAAQVRDNGLVYGDAEIFDDVRVVNGGQVCGDARIGGRTVVDGVEKTGGVESHAPQRRPSARGRGRRARSPRGPRP
jgi:acyl-[acyl carrier protein]--UDP-N-acetylglucosamine O-acyltransferase